MQPSIFDVYTSEMSKMQKFVKLCIDRHPEAVNDDAALEAAGLELKGLGSYDYFYRLLKRAHRTETLTRRRRELIQAGIVKASDEATKRREEAMSSERDLARTKPHWSTNL